MKRDYGILEKIIQWGKSLLAVETVQKSVTVGAGTGAGATVDLSKSGYTPIAIVGFQIAGDSSGRAEIRQWRLNGSQAYAYVWNNNSASQTWTLTFHVLWLKTIGGGYCIAVFSMLSAIFSLVRRWRHEKTVQHLEGNCRTRIQVLRPDLNSEFDQLFLIMDKPIMGICEYITTGECSDGSMARVNKRSRSISGSVGQRGYAVQTFDARRNGRNGSKRDHSLALESIIKAIPERGCVA